MALGLCIQWLNYVIKDLGFFFPAPLCDVDLWLPPQDVRMATVIHTSSWILQSPAEDDFLIILKNKIKKTQQYTYEKCIIRT